MLDMPCILILHQSPFPLAEHLGAQRGHVGFVAELLEGREERFEVEDDGAREGETAQRLPVDAQVDAREGQGGGLGEPEGFVRVRGRHEERGVNFESPGAALDGAGGREFGEVSGWAGGG